MNPQDILEGPEAFVSYLRSKGFALNPSYVDKEHPTARFLDISDNELLAIDECRDEQEVRTAKSHFLIDRGLTHCALVCGDRILFYRNYGEIRHFIYSKRTARYKSKIDKLRRIGEGIDILFQLKDLSNDFYETFKQKRDLLVRAIRSDIDDTQKYLISQRIFDRIFFIYFLCHKGLIKFSNGRAISGTTLFRVMLEDGKFLENLYALFDSFNNEKGKTVSVGEFAFQLPFLNGGLFRLGREEFDLQMTLPISEWQKIFGFLDSYHWIIEDDTEEIEQEKILTPEILGHVYERSVVEWEQKGFQEEVAEASGKTERKAKGVYYTPEAVTDFICRNTIHSILLSRLSNRFPEVRDLLRSGTRADYESALEVLAAITILDPACGSGAFLIKAADVVFQLEGNILSQLGRKPDHYQIKLNIITKNIYGVDLLQGATEIAKLRLWLWLVSSYSDQGGVTPLPNIEYNIVVGNSLIGWTTEKLSGILSIPLTEEAGKAIDDLVGSTSGTLGKALANSKRLLESYELGGYVEAYSRLHHEYMNAHGEQATLLKAVLTQIKRVVYPTIDQSFLNSTNDDLPKNKRIPFRDLRTSTFHWGYDFGEIVKDGGFDVVVGNPPYVRVESLDHAVTDFLKVKYTSVYERCDLYVPFIQKFYELVRQDGMIGFIAQNQFMVADYGLKLRGMIAASWGLNRIIDFTNYTPFHDVSTYSCIVLGSREKHEVIHVSRVTSKEAVAFWEDRRFIEPVSHPNIETFDILASELSEKRWILRSDVDRGLLEKMGTSRFHDWKSEIAVASPLKSGRDSILVSQVIDESDSNYLLLFKDGRKLRLEKGIWKPLLRPQNIDKWTVSQPTEVVFFPYTVADDKFELIPEITFRKEYPQTYEYLSKFRRALLDRRDSRLTWEEKGLPWYTLHRLGTPENHSPDKLVTRTVIDKPSFSYDPIGYLVPTGGVCGVTVKEIDPFFLLGYLNSSAVYFYLKANSPPKQNNYISLRIQCARFYQPERSNVFR